MLTADVGTLNDAIQCGICMEPVRKRNRIILPCSHAFHKKCILKWLRKSSSCPICRSTRGMDSLVNEARFWANVVGRILGFVFFSLRIMYLFFSVFGYNPFSEGFGRNITNRYRELVHVVRSTWTTSMNSFFGVARIYTRTTAWLTGTVSSLSFRVFSFFFDAIFVRYQSSDDTESNRANRLRRFVHAIHSTWTINMNSLFGIAIIWTRAVLWLIVPVFSFFNGILISIFDVNFENNRSSGNFEDFTSIDEGDLQVIVAGCTGCNNEGCEKLLRKKIEEIPREVILLLIEICYEFFLSTLNNIMILNIINVIERFTYKSNSPPLK